ncbi:MAG: EAL domain-containing protein [Methylococcaceae bacterium]|nr:MAG: EAL domain-containing protein [Methylococcaceae bacterium]
MRALTVGDALCRCEHVVRVNADERPLRNRQTVTIYAVFAPRPEGDNGGPQQAALAVPLRGHFLGLVTKRDIAHFPQRIFADLLDPNALPPLNPDTPLDGVYGADDIAHGFELPLPVVAANGEFIGVITRSSVLEALLTRERLLLEETRRLNELLEEDRAQLSAWSSRLAELHEASRTLLGLLVHTTLRTDLLQAGIDALAKLLQARYGAIGILERGELTQFVYCGVTPTEAERIGRLPEGRGLLGVVVQEDQSLRLDDLTQDPRSAGFPPHHPAMTALLAVPISNLGNVYGRIYLCDKLGGAAFTAEDELLAQSFAHSLSMVLDNAREIEETQNVVRRLDFMAHFDSLTGLPNRELFADRLQQIIAEHTRYKRYVAILFLDIDNFKVVNDALGHPAGDELLIAATERIRHVIRESDTIARFGGDEFTVMLADLEEPSYAAAVAQKILNAMTPPFLLGDEHEMYVSISIGIAVYPTDGGAIEPLLKNADTAMYYAKSQGKNNYQFFAEDMNVEAQQRLEMERHLRNALQRQEMTLHYQPQLDLLSGETVGVEALLRWSSPVLGQVTPARFIPIAEETGLIIPIGAWVLRTACQQARVWRDMGLPHLRMAVNLSVRQFRHAELKETVLEALQENGLPADALELEITESMMMQGTECTMSILRELKAIGIRISVDDFGTGYSSLSYLKRFPIDTLKIDQSFVRDIASDPDDAAIVSAIIAMAASLKLNTIAEGVETEQQADFLRRHECRYVQGYFFGMPQPAEQITCLLGGKKQSMPAPPCLRV